MLTLSVQTRDESQSNEELRNNHRMPAVYYGRKTDSTPISIDIPSFKRTWVEAGESTVITLVDEDDDEHGALIQDVQVHPVTDEPLHADFYIFAKGQKVTVDIPLEFVGEAPAVKNKGAMLVKVMHEIEVEAEPRDLPQSIEVDISALEEFDDSVFVKDLSVKEGVNIKAEPDETIVLASEPVEEEELEEEAAEVDFDEMVEVAGEVSEEELEEGEIPEEGAPEGAPEGEHEQEEQQ